MMSNEFTQLVVPQPGQISINSNAKECPSDGFNYPKFRQLNKQERVRLSFKPYEHQPTTHYVLFAVANSKGWFTAVTMQEDRSYSLVFSPLADLRSALISVKDNQSTFSPKRVIGLGVQKPTIVSFASNNATLIVAFEGGELLVYDTVPLFTPGNDTVNPIHTLPSTRGPIRQLASNPGPEATHVDLFAAVHADRSVVLYNTKLEVQGGWISSQSSSDSTPVAIAWSPKGKNIAIGLQSGDILTYSLTNKSAVHKHVPPTNRGPLASLDWLTPGHTFRTTYGGPGTDPVQHIVCVDLKAATGTYFAPNFPFPASDRSNQSYILALQKWDEDSGATEPKSLVVVADKASVDFEILGSSGTQWYQESQESPLSLPLNEDQGDTLLLGLAVDLTDAQAGDPVMYAYLDDGTVQGWYLESSKPYSGMVASETVTTAAPTSVPSTTPTAPDFGQPSAFGQTSASSSAFGQPSAFGTSVAPAFGTSGFGQNTTTSAFGQSSFGQTSTPSAFGASSFGQASTPTNSAFGNLQSQSSPFGQPANPSAFGAGSGAFGGGSSTSSSVLGGSGPSTGAFGGFGGSSTTNAFGGSSFGTTASPSTFGGGNSFAALANNNDNNAQNVFGQGSFGAPNSSATTLAVAPVITRDESMADDTPSLGSLGGMGLGAPNDESQPVKSGGIFGSFDTSSAPPSSTSAFGLIKPASGAFGNFGTSSTTEQKPLEQPAQPKPASGFGQSGFGTSSFGQQPAFGQSSFGQPAGAAQPVSVVGGGFGAFASSSNSFAAAKQTSTPVTTGGFGAFASGGPSTFGATAPSTSSGAFGAVASPANTFGTTTAQTTSSSPFSAASSNSSSPSPFGAPASGSPFGTSGSGVSPFGPQPGVRAQSPSEKEDEPPQSSPTKTPLKPAGLADSPPSSPEATPRLGKASIARDNDSPPAPSTTTPLSSPFGNVLGPSSGAFANLMSTPSVFKPATGFGAFGSDKTPTTSPFFKPESKSSDTAALSSAFAATSTGTVSTSTSPAFGSASALGARSAFSSALSASPTASPTPAKVPSTGGFGAFSGASSSFGAFAGPKTSFSELLKVGDDEPSASPSPPADVGKSKPISAFPIIGKSTPAPVFTPPPKEEEDTTLTSSKVKSAEKSELSDEPSYGNLSSISDASSFAEINPEESDEDDVRSGSDDDAEAEVDEASFLSDDVEEGEIDEEDEDSSEGESSQLSDVPEEEEEEEEEEVEEEEEEAVTAQRSKDVLDPAAVPLPPSRSPSATPQPEVPKVHITPSPPPESSLQQIREESTTPPGTPIKESVPPRAASAPAPSTPFGLGIGRPSTRPARSSPLATSTVPLADDDTPPTPSKPISPQPHIAALPVKDLTDKDTDKPPRPKTPPLLSSFVAGPSKSVSPSPTNTPIPPPAVLEPPSLAAPTASLPGSFGKHTLSTIGPSSDTKKSSAPSPGVFSSPSTGPLGITPVTHPISAGLDSKGKIAETPSTMSRPGATSPFGNFNIPPTSEKPPPSLFAYVTPRVTPPLSSPSVGFGNLNFRTNTASSTSSSTNTPTPPSTGLSLKGSAPTTPTPPVPVPIVTPSLPALTVAPAIVPVEVGLQRECMAVYNAVTEDLAALGILAEKHMKVLRSIQAQSNVPRSRADFGNLKDWSNASSIQFGKILVQYEKDLDELRDARGKQSTKLKEIQSDILKAKTRKEEIARFNRAKDDKEFAKMLKARSLGPEYLETQAQLRRSIRLIRDRVQTLEDHLKGSKKKLTQVKTGRPSIRPPTLDSINRTYRNIDLALNQQAARLALLKKRFTKLRTTAQQSKSNETSSPVPERDPRLPPPSSHRRSLSAVMPDVAATTAAALNAERAAHRLKRALLQARSEPLLNTAASVAPIPPLSFSTPQKEESLAWAPPERRGATSAKKHGVIHFPKKTGGNGSGSATAASFDWGPLPTFEYEKKGESFTMVEAVKLTPPRMS